MTTDIFVEITDESFTKSYIQKSRLALLQAFNIVYSNRSLKAVVDRIFINFCDNNVVKNIIFCDKMTNMGYA